MIHIPTIVVLAKAPVPGRVKTRLCPPLRPLDAAHLAAAALTDTLDCVARVRGVRHVLALDGSGVAVPASFEIVGQEDGDLGHRLDGVLTLSDGPTLVIGMDTPQLSTRLLLEALDRLSRHDAVLGPAVDGGFWAIGLSEPGVRLFGDVPMSTPETGALTRRHLESLTLDTATLPMLRDVDTFADAVAVATAAPGSRFARAFETIMPALVQ